MLSGTTFALVSLAPVLSTRLVFTTRFMLTTRFVALVHHGLRP
jgi:hypothetical protein